MARITFTELMAQRGYTVQTTFWEDFSIADRFGKSAVLDTFKRAFAEWKTDYKYLTEMVLVLNPKLGIYSIRVIKSFRRFIPSFITRFMIMPALI